MDGPIRHEVSLAHRESSDAESAARHVGLGDLPNGCTTTPAVWDDDDCYEPVESQGLVCDVPMVCGEVNGAWFETAAWVRMPFADPFGTCTSVDLQCLLVGVVNVALEASRLVDCVRAWTRGIDDCDGRLAAGIVTEEGAASLELISPIHC